MSVAPRKIRFTLNGSAVEATVPPHLSLVELLREEFEASLETTRNDEQAANLDRLPGNDIRRTALAAARKRTNELWRAGTIGDEAYRTLESEFDWAELSAGAD